MAHAVSRHRATSRTLAAIAAAVALAGTPVPVRAAPARAPAARVPPSTPLPPRPLPDATLVLPDLPVPPAAAAEPLPSPKPMGLPESGTTWLDAGHDFVGNMFGTVLRFDRFFSDERDLDIERAQSFLRWRNDLRLSEGRTFSLDTSLRADLKLPGLNQYLKRLRLVITGQTEDTLSTLFPEPDGGGGTANVGTADAELRYGLVDTLRTHVDIGAGVLLRLPPGVRTRARIRHAFPVNGSVLVRMATTGFWETRLGFGDTMQLDVERRFGTLTLLRWENAATISQKSEGWEWGTGPALFQRLGMRTAVALGGTVSGHTLPVPEVTQRRLFVRFRRDVFRRWLFYELEPEAIWPVVDSKTQPRELGIIFRLEVQFHGTELLEEATPDRAAPARR